MSILYIVATPIGNLEDITLRALRVLKEVDVVFAEDTREAKKLLNHFEIEKLIERYDEHSHETQSEKVLEFLKDGKSVAYISDAGTPAISDPGARLVSYIKNHLPSVSIIPIPGASAVTAALSASGFSSDQFTFLGFVPHKKGRQNFFEEVRTCRRTVVFYESTHRILRTLESLKEVLEESRYVVVARELTKLYEEIKGGNATEILAYYEANKDKIRGEFVVMVEGKK